MQYKGYTGVVVFDESVGMLHGRVAGIRSVVTFEGRDATEIEAAFRDSVDDYLEFCAQKGVEPEKPFSGRLLLRIRPRLHEALARAAAEEGVSVNAFVEARLAAAVAQAAE